MLTKNSFIKKSFSVLLLFLLILSVFLPYSKASAATRPIARFYCGIDEHELGRFTEFEYLYNASINSIAILKPKTMADNDFIKTTEDCEQAHIFKFYRILKPNSEAYKTSEKLALFRSNAKSNYYLAVNADYESKEAGKVRVFLYAYNDDPWKLANIALINRYIEPETRITFKNWLTGQELGRATTKVYGTIYGQDNAIAKGHPVPVVILDETTMKKAETEGSDLYNLNPDQFEVTGGWPEENQLKAVNKFVDFMKKYAYKDMIGIFSDGEYTFKNLAYGNYYLLAFDAPPTRLYPRKIFYAPFPVSEKAPLVKTDINFAAVGSTTEGDDLLGQVIKAIVKDIYTPALEKIIEWTKAFFQVAFEQIKSIVESTVIIPSAQLKNPGIQGTWQAIVNICNILFILGLLIIVFANVLRIQLDYYAIKTLLPRLIIAMIFINFSLLMCMAILDFANLLSKQLFDIPYIVSQGQAKPLEMKLQGTEIAGVAAASVPGIIAVSYIMGIIGFLTPTTMTAVGVGIVLFFIIIILGGLIIGLLLAGMLIVRVLMIWFLAIISPLVFLFMVLPFTRGLSSRWWSEWVRWVFMGPIVVLILSIGEGMMATMGSPPTAQTLGSSAGGGIEWLKPIFAIAMILAAFAVPSILGGQIMGFAKGLAGRAWGAAMATPMIAMWRQRAQAARFERAGARLGALGRALRLPELEAMGEAGIASAAEHYNMRGMGDKQLVNLARRSRGAVREAARRELFGRGLLSDFYTKNRLTPGTDVERRLVAQSNPLIAAGENDETLQAYLRQYPQSAATIGQEPLQSARYWQQLRIARGEGAAGDAAQAELIRGLSKDKAAWMIASPGIIGSLGKQAKTQLVSQALGLGEEGANFIKNNMGVLGECLGNLTVAHAKRHEWDAEAVKTVSEAKGGTEGDRLRELIK